MYFNVSQMFCGACQKDILSGEKYFETTWKINVELRSRKVFVPIVFFFSLRPSSNFEIYFFILDVFSAITKWCAQSKYSSHCSQNAYEMYAKLLKFGLGLRKLIRDKETDWVSEAGVRVCMCIYIFSFVRCMFHMVSTMSSESNFCLLFTSQLLWIHAVSIRKEL